MQTESHLQPNNSKGWVAGFRNMLGEENAKWWSLKPLVIQLLLWLVVINGLVALIMSGNTYSPTIEDRVNNGMMNFFNLSSFLMPLAAAIMAHGSMLKERESGTAAWLLSKPLSRKAFVISKFLANSTGFFIIVVLAQGAIAYAQFSYALGKPLAAVPYFEGIVVLGIICLFVLVLSIALGVFTMSRSIALGIPLFIAVGVPLILTMIAPDLSKVFPTAVVWQQAPIPELTITAMIPVAIMVLISIAAIWKFERTEM